mmetsp:Transcript_26375/g.41251  ORF Transcript_26375/g.41251 Transcript_26375/m.41251 type:complete len:353 (+) Transcript_26375:73-1131(+)|eukprot:CAMPEP_0184289100 /NCGR_PEP_ID=MMETSP1049-20130417/1558_1 /TAXON_ID=77928 /ORGANISM="Proteomonas sulcata, Strain CCMP704" /LENGTH=352 /DNA_ID=CAMNT_0026595755 /DNA_START=40 /DNA_END=1098 /DNA_ORIENTATION=-
MPKKAPPAIAAGGGYGGFGGGFEGAPHQNPQDSFVVTASGTFNKDDFKIKSTGIEQTAAGVGPVSDLEMNDLDVEDIAFGGGASGTVRRAFHRPTQRIIALKSINVNDKGKRDQMMQELRLLTDVGCPNLVKFYDAFWAEPFIHLAIEFMDAGSLDVCLKKCAQPNEEVVSVCMRQLLAGLNFLHRERHALHRDLKPGNVLLKSDGVVKVADFGISREMDNTMAYAATFTGTAIYMSPERMQGKRYSFTADIWSVGLITTECVWGKYPYNMRPDMKYFDLVMTIVNQPAPIPGEGFSAELNSFAEAALSKQDDQRATAEMLLSHAYVQKFAGSPEAVVAEWLKPAIKPYQAV